MKTSSEILEFIKTNKLYAAGVKLHKASPGIIDYLATQIKDNENVSYAFLCDAVECDGKEITMGETGVIITNKKIIYGRPKSGFLSQAVLKMTDVTDLDDVTYKDKEFGVLSGTYKVVIDATRELIGFVFCNCKENKTLAEKLTSDLSDILDEIKEKNKSSLQTVIQQRSAADEILKYKSLLDADIITKEEFEKKKKELLGL